MEVVYNSLQLINEAANDKLAKYNLEKKLILLWQNITDDTEIFWQEFVLLKDLFSFKFNKRELPLLKEELEKQKLEVTDINIEKVKHTVDKKTMFMKIKSKYGRKSTILKMLNEDYTDEADQIHYKVLQNHKYYQQFSQQDLLFLLKTCQEKQLYNIMLLIIVSLSCSREYCHYIFQEHILDLVFNDAGYPYNGNVFKSDRYLEIFHHSMFYGFYILYLEECIIKGQALNHRHILDFAAMGRIPNYLGSLDQHPFIPLTLSSEYLHATHIIPTEYIVKPIITENKNRGVYSIYSFWKRFDIFTDGIFRGLAVDKIYFGGSILAACGVRNPLEKLFNCQINNNDDLHYLNISLPDDANYENYLAKIANLFSMWDSKKDNLTAYFDEYYPSKNIINQEDIKKYATNNTKFLEMEDNLADIDIKIDLVDDTEFNKITNIIFETIKNNICKNKNLQYENINGNMLQLIKVCSNKSYKYYISGTLLSRSIEIYRLYSIHPIGGVSRFHFSCVRGVAIPSSYLTNEQLLYGQVICHPSFYSFAFTGILIDYKWMAHGSSAIELILKYYSRGCTVILNAKEHKKIKDYILANPEKWGVMLKSGNSKYISINNPIFKPRKYKYGIYHNISKIFSQKIIPYFDYQYVDEDLEEMKNWQCANVRTAFGFDFNLRAPSGHINPIYTWQILPFIKN